ncbi:MAG: hypothetical protein J6X75_01380 [Clostridia bacterium]|nr:hypothetical protein [Clostridia bacterium]
MIISDQQWKEIKAYMDALETFCIYSINEEISTFWTIAKKPGLILKWRERVATKLYMREFSSRIDYPVHHKPGTILQNSGYFSEVISDDKDNKYPLVNNDSSDWTESVKDIDRQICKSICADLCDPDCFEASELTDEERAKAISELRRPLKYQKPKGGDYITIGKVH